MDESWSAVPEWIEKAEADWEVVQTLSGTGSKTLHDAIVFHAQQCTEKLLKARLIQLGQAIRRPTTLPCCRSYSNKLTLIGAGMKTSLRN